MTQASPKRERRINMRVTDEQERILRAAADLSGETLTGFVLSVATERAADVVARAQRIEISAEAFGRFVAALDGPAEDRPLSDGTPPRRVRFLRVEGSAAPACRGAPRGASPR
jgi:uncharacterized protein (DUF1778 family)